MRQFKQSRKANPPQSWALCWFCRRELHKIGPPFYTVSNPGEPEQSRGDYAWWLCKKCLVENVIPEQLEELVVAEAGASNGNR